MFDKPTKMERREDVLRQALDKNAHETERWQAYKADNEDAIKNLNMFDKNLSVEVMVPIGKKAFMPGQLIHTNELLVGHYQGYFSACSAHKAKEICQHRLSLAEQHLKQLEVEADLWHNKLEKPLREGAVANAGEVDIVEDYNEEEHNNWLEEHKASVRKQKQVERTEREAQHSNDNQDVFNKLEEREMLEELGLDPDNFNEQALNVFLNNSTATDSAERKDCKTALTDEQVFDMLEKLEAKEQQQEAAEMDEMDLEQNLQDTNDLVHNLMSNQAEVTAVKQRIGRALKSNENSNEDEQENETDLEDALDEDVPEEVQLIRAQLALLPSEQREEFLNAQLQIIKAKMRKIQKKEFINDELTHLMDVVVCLEDDLQEMLFEQIQAISTEELSDEAEEPLSDEAELPLSEEAELPLTEEAELPLSEKAELTKAAKNKKRRISFAKTDEQLLFKKHESVAAMMPKIKPQAQQKSTVREIISLDAPLKHVQNEQPKQPTSPKILQKVEQNVEFVKQHQSVQDFDLVNQILEVATGQIKTLHISFKHSEAVAETAAAASDESTPGNPAHFYELYEKTLAKTQSEHEFPIYVNSFEGEQELKVPILTEEAREAAYNDPRTQFFKTSVKLSETANSTETKSILRNKSLVELESRSISEQQPQPYHFSNNKSKKNKNKKKKPRSIDDQLRDMSAYQKVMHDLVEKEEPTAPEPLPKGKYIDAHAPKKRISRFKEQRSMNKT